MYYDKKRVASDIQCTMTIFSTKKYYDKFELRMKEQP